MIPRKEILKNRVLSLILKSKNARNTKLGYVFQNGAFHVGVQKKAKLLERAKRSRALEVRINGSSQMCRPKVVDDFSKTKAFLKKEIERLIGKKLGPNSRSAQKLDGMAARHVVLELKPIRGG